MYTHTHTHTCTHIVTFHAFQRVLYMVAHTCEEENDLKLTHNTYTKTHFVVKLRLFQHALYMVAHTCNGKSGLVCGLAPGLYQQPA